LLVFGFAVAACLFLAAVNADATPLRPDIRKLVAQPRETMQFAPARAGWDGPETARDDAGAGGPTSAQLTMAAAQRSSRAALLTAALPDPRAVIAIVAAILMLRLLRWRHEHEMRRGKVLAMPPRAVPPPEQKAA
jgi:hypothetical protein